MGTVLSFMRVFLRSEKVERNIRLIAHYPTVMSGTDVKDVSRLHDVRSSIFHGTRSSPGYHHANVLHLTKGTPSKGRDVLRPFPAGFVCCPANRHSADLDEFEPSFVKSAYLIRILKSFDQEVIIIRQHSVSSVDVLKRIRVADTLTSPRKSDYSNPAMR